MKQFTNEINKLDYDILLLGGDYLNYTSMIDPFFNDFALINKAEHNFSVLGNHDYIAYDLITEKLAKEKVINIDNANQYLKKYNINISGVDDL